VVRAHGLSATISHTNDNGSSFSVPFVARRAALRRLGGGAHTARTKGAAGHRHGNFGARPPVRRISAGRH